MTLFVTLDRIGDAQHQRSAQYYSEAKMIYQSDSLNQLRVSKNACVVVVTIALYPVVYRHNQCEK
jgi:hypothetical protein